LPILFAHQPTTVNKADMSATDNQTFEGHNLGAMIMSVEAVEKPIFHPEMVVKMAQDFLRHLHFIN